MSAVVVLALLTGAVPTADAQGSRRSRTGVRRLLKFDWNCASPSEYPKGILGREVQALLKRKYAEWDAEADRAFAFDLNGDRRPEYFVPLVCGGTGNCDWGVFTLKPARFLGVVNGQYLYVRASAGRWPDIAVYGHMTAAEGTVGTYVFRKGRYASLGDSYPAGDVNRWSQIWDVPLRRVPARLERAKAACERLGW